MKVKVCYRETISLCANNDDLLSDIRRGGNVALVAESHQVKQRNVGIKLQH